MEIEHLIFSEGPQRVAPFSHAVRAGEYIFITGQMPTLKHDNTKLVEGGIEEQTNQVMKNLIDVKFCWFFTRKSYICTCILSKFSRLR